MSRKVVIVDYGMGNLQSVRRKLDRLISGIKVSSSPTDVLSASHIVLPGVGHFGNAMNNLRTLHLLDALNEAVLVKKTPILGICLGMQLMAAHSEEGDSEGIGWLDAQVVRFRVRDTLKYKVPHIGWNNVDLCKDSPLMQGISSDALFYFVHSYYMVCNNAQDELNRSTYESSFVSAVSHDNIFGVQYHPEKSQEVGEKLLRNFVSL